MPYMIDKIGSSVTKLLKVLTIYCQMDGAKINQKCVLLQRNSGLYTEFEEDFTDFFDDLRAHAKQN
jgi:hypothetical protein